MIDASRLIRKSGDYCFAPKGAVTDAVLLDVADRYEAEVSNRFLSIKPSELPQRYGPDSRVLATTKYDGEGVFVYFEAGRDPEVFAFNSPSGRVRIGLPCLVSLAANLRARGVRKALLRAELYLREVVDGRRANSADVARASYSTDPADAGRLRLAVFDAVMHNGRDLRPHQSDFLTIWELLGDWSGADASKPVHRAEGGLFAGGDLPGLFATLTGSGLEGLVLRRLDRPEVCKLKPRVAVDAAVVGFVEGDFEGSYGVTSLLTALAYPGAGVGSVLQLQAIARVGSGFDDQGRVDWLARLSGQRVAAPLAMSDSDGRPVRFVRPQFVVEIEAEDALPGEEDGAGQQVFDWNGSGWTFRGLAAGPRLLFPTYARLRSDKEFTIQSVRIGQLLRRDLGQPELINRHLPGLEIVRREVYTKEVKGALAVRKLVVGRRPPTAGAFPFVVFWTDYSAGRKTPLEVSTLFAHTEARASALAAKLLAENITKGFERHDENRSRAAVTDAGSETATSRRKAPKPTVPPPQPAG